jgi:DNA-binding NarL/FixJ family response regulator
VSTLRIVLGEDSYLAREGIMRALEDVDAVDVVATCADLDELRSAIDGLQPDVVLTDIRMPPTNTDEGIRLAGELRRSHPEMGVVVLSQHADPLYAVSLFEDGSDRRGYLLKERLKDEGELSRALHEVADGGSVVDPYIVERLVGARSGGVDPRGDKLTPREREILGMIAEGRSNAAIARELYITTRAVERHINAIFTRLELAESGEANRRVQAVLVYLAGLKTL